MDVWEFTWIFCGTYIATQAVGLAILWCIYGRDR